MFKLPERHIISPRRAISLASIVAILSGIQLMTCNLYVGIYLEEDLLTSLIIITAILSARNFLQLFLRIPLGELSQIIGRKPLILLGHFSYSTAVIFLFLASDWVLVFVAIIFVAIGMSAFWSSLFAYIADFTPGNFGENNGKIFRAWDIGIIIASLAAKVMLDVLSISLRELFMIISSFGLISGIFCIIILPEGLVEEQRKQVESVPRALYGSLATMLTSLIRITRKKGMLEVYAYQFVISFLEFMVQAFFPFLIVARGFSKGTVGEIAFWATLALLWFKPYFGKITDRVPFTSLLTVIVLISSSVVLLMTAVTELWLIIFLYLIYSGFIVTAYTAENGETARRAPAAYRGISLGILGFYVSSGRTFSTVVLGPVWDFVNLEAVFLIGAMSAFVASVILFILYSRNNRKQAKKIQTSIDEGRTVDMNV